MDTLEGRLLMAATPLTSNTTVTSTIGVLGEIDEYSFAANAGQTVVLSMGRNTGSGIETGFEVFAPNGTSLGSGGGTNTVTGYFEFTPTVNGTYKVNVRGADSTVGSYNLHYVKLPHAGAITDPGDADGKLLVSNTTITSDIEKLGDVDLYSINVTAGAQVILSLGRGNGSFVETGMTVYKPDGSMQVITGGNNQISAYASFTATVTGKYFAVVRGVDRTVGAYNLHTFKSPHVGPVTDPVDKHGKALVSNSTVLASINNIGDLDLYTFTATKDQRVALSMGRAPGSVVETQYTIYLPSGAVYDSEGSNNDASIYSEFLAPVAGEYKVLVRSLDNGTGAYNLHFIKFPDTAPKADPADQQGGFLASSVTKTASIATYGDVDLYFFYAAKGDQLSINLSSSDGVDKIFEEMRLYSPTGVPINPVNDAVSINFTAQVNGLYNLVVAGRQLTYTSPYKIKLDLIPDLVNSKSSITVVASDALAVEGGFDDGAFRITRTNNRALPLVVEYSLTGSATNGTDYDVLTGTVTIPANQASVLVNVNAKSDGANDNNETVVLTLKPKTASYLLGGAKTGTVNIITGASVSGNVFRDVNGDGIKNGADNNLSGWTVFVDIDNDGVLDATERSVLTDTSGNYTLTGLANGSTRVRAVIKPGFTASLPVTGVQGVNLAVGQNVTGKDLGYKPN